MGGTIKNITPSFIESIKFHNNKIDTLQNEFKLKNGEYIKQNL